MSSVKKLFNRIGKRKKSRHVGDIPHNISPVAENPNSLIDQQSTNEEIDQVEPGSTEADQNFDDEYCKPIDMKTSSNVYDQLIDCQMPEQEVGNIYDDVFDTKQPQDQSIDDPQETAILRNRRQFHSSQKRISRPHLPSQDSRAPEDYDDPWQSITDQSTKLVEKMRHSISDSHIKPMDDPVELQPRPFSVDDKTMPDTEIKQSLKSYDHKQLAMISSDSISENGEDPNRSPMGLSPLPQSLQDTENDDYEDPWTNNDAPRKINVAAVDANRQFVTDSNNTKIGLRAQSMESNKPEVPPRLPDEVLQSMISVQDDGDDDYTTPCDETINKPPLEDNGWFHGPLSRNQAETLMKDVDIGSYLVRNSESSKFQKVYSLSVRTQANGIIHIKIDPVTDGYVIGKNGKVFPSLENMIEHYQNNPLRIKGAERQSLLYPINK
ncbi:SH2 domain-containing adapter protein F [Trichoplax sp. H2]|nr:SH2 domain-containing adapter protein F [Trichoplax sp. H2]|eukprot:RDD43753.1 SH2 domain-containing adapter protein F [Trichoplax sp. H2]